MRPPRRNRQPSKKVLHAGAKSSNTRRQTRAEIQRKRRVLNHEGELDVGQGVDLDITKWIRCPTLQELIQISIERLEWWITHTPVPCTHLHLHRSPIRLLSVAPAPVRETPWDNLSRVNTIEQKRSSSVNGRFRVETTEVRRVHVHSSLLVVTSNQNASNKKKSFKYIS